MTREEQIRNAAKSFKETGEICLIDCFVTAAKWTDAHPNWHKCTNTLPTAKLQRCICTDGRDVFLALWVDCTEEGGLSGWELNGMYNEPTAWMELPQPPKFD